MTRFGWIRYEYPGLKAPRYMSLTDIATVISVVRSIGVRLVLLVLHSPASAGRRRKFCSVLQFNFRTFAALREIIFGRIQIPS
jgi:hypothetical protein